MDGKIGLHGGKHVYIHMQNYVHIPTLVGTNHLQSSTNACSDTSHVCTNIHKHLHMHVPVDVQVRIIMC